MQLKLATWNINSVRLRIGLVERFLAEFQPDILCLQEIKCLPDQFPAKAIAAAGYPHIEITGQKAYHGVATVSRIPFTSVARRGFCEMDDARHLAVTVGEARPVEIHNFYVPSGGDEPDPDANDKFAHKLAFMKEMATCFREEYEGEGKILVGDLNVAPLEHDVWSHRQMLNVVSHTPVEVEHLAQVQASLDWADLMRDFVPPEEKLYSWWSYRAKDWAASNRGRRLDHIWSTPDLRGAAKSMQVVSEARGWEKPSDHAPVIGVFEI